VKDKQLFLFKLKIIIKKSLGFNGFVRIKNGPNKGLFFYMNHNTNLEYLTGEYEETLTKILINNVGAGSVIFDVGAHYGYHSLMFSELSGRTGRIFTFEPDRHNYQILQKNVEKNSILNIATFRLAVSDYSGVIDFTNNSNSYANTAVSGSPIFSNSEITKVSCVDLDHFVIEEKLERVDFIKIDIEGHELNALKGAENTLLNYRPDIYLATHDNHFPGVSEKCLLFLKKLGYKSQQVSVTIQSNQMKDYFLSHDI